MDCNGRVDTVEGNSLPETVESLKAQEQQGVQQVPAALSRTDSQRTETLD